MAAYLWSSLVNQQQIQFDPALDTLVFPAGVTIPDLTTWSGGFNPDPTQPYLFSTIIIDGQPSTFFEYDGKRVYLVGLTDANITPTNIVLSDGSALLIGDLLAGTSADFATPLSIVGGNGAEYLQGNGFNDSLNGGAGNDSLFGGNGNDFLDGGDGFDIALWGRGSTLGVYANLLTGIATQGTDSDTLVSIEGLRGTNRNDALIGDGNNNYFKGLMGFDYLDGGAGSDVAQYGDWQVINGISVDLSAGAASNDGFGTSDILVNIEDVKGTVFDDQIRGDANRNRLEGQQGNDILAGLAGADTLIGGSGDDQLLGGDGSDYLIGGAGNDNLVGGDSLPDFDIDSVDYAAAQGGLTLNLATGTATAAGTGTDMLSGIEEVIGTSFADILNGDANDNYFRGGQGNDTINGGTGFDIAEVIDATDAVIANLATGAITASGVGSDVLTSIEGIYASQYADNLVGSAGNDLFRGNAGNDSINGGTGSDITDYRNAANAVSVNLATGVATGGDGTDTLISIENVLGSMFDDLLIGNADDNSLRGRLGNDTLDGAAGHDRADYRTASGSVTVDLDGGIAIGADGLDVLLNMENIRGSYFDDNLSGDEFANTVQGLYGNDVLRGSGGDDLLFGDDGTDLLVGGSGNDLLDGGAGADQMIGGLGDDTYYIDQVLDTITETDTGGTDTANSSLASYTLGANVENGRILATGAANITGNVLNNVLYGGAGDNILDGGLGNDIMTGGAGNDTYYVRQSLDAVMENASEGTDTVNSYLASYTLDANVENGRILTTSTANLTGNLLNNVLYASTGDNIMDGASGVDTASYTYAAATVNVSLATTTAQATGSSGSDSLINIENLTGSNYNDTLTGNIGNNILDGGLGNDIMTGGAGNDTYYVRQSLDAVMENASEGTDTVISYLASYTLGANVENGRILTTGTANLTGNDLSNVLFAGVGNNILGGGSSADSSIDTVSYLYGVTGTTGVTISLAITSAQATGSSGSDTLLGIEQLIGSSYADALTGSAGNNVLTGGGGADTLVGNGGNDTFDFNTLAEMGLTSTTCDVITDFSSGDKIDLSTLDARFSTLNATNEAFTFIGTTSFNNTDASGQLRYSVDTANNTRYIYGSTDMDAAAEFVIKITGVNVLSAADFVL